MPHAKIPWISTSIDYEYISIKNEDGEVVLDGCGCCGSPFTDEKKYKENIALMTAAPDLLWSVERIIEWLDNYEVEFSENPEWLIDREQIIFIIKKAKAMT